MTNKSKPRGEPWQLVFDQLAGDQSGPLLLEKHLKGCCAAYQLLTSYKGRPDIGDGTYFAFEAIWGVVNSRKQEAKTDRTLKEDPDWGLPPLTTVGVPWLWLVALAEAWERSGHGEKPIGKALGLEGSRGQRPKSSSMTQLLNRRAIAFWINDRADRLRDQKIRNPVQQAKADASNEFDMGDDTIRAIWDRHGSAARRRSLKIP